MNFKIKTMKSKAKLKCGAVYEEEKRTLRTRAINLLREAKSNPEEQKKVPFRVDHRTIILVSPARRLELLNQK